MVPKAAALQAASRAGAPVQQELRQRWEEAQSEPDSGLLTITLAGADEPIGLLGYRSEAPAPAERWLNVEFIAVAPEHRGWGRGSEAVRLLESEIVRPGGVWRSRADVDARNGLCLYFWLRLGYRPAGVDETFWLREGEQGIISMIRTLARAPLPLRGRSDNDGRGA